MPNCWQLSRSVSICFFEIGSQNRQAAIGRRHVVVGGGHGPLGPAHLAAGQPQPLERLGTGYLVDQLKVDVKNRLLSRLAADDVVVPNLFEHRAGRTGCCHGS